MRRINQIFTGTFVKSTNRLMVFGHNIDTPNKHRVYVNRVYVNRVHANHYNSRRRAAAAAAGFLDDTITTPGHMRMILINQ